MNEVKPWEFAELPFGAYFRPLWAKHEIWPLQGINLKFATMSPQPTIGPAVKIANQDWTLGQLPTAFEWSWDLIEFYPCFGEVPPAPWVRSGLTPQDQESIRAAILDMVQTAFKANEAVLKAFDEKVDDILKQLADCKAEIGSLKTPAAQAAEPKAGKKS